MELFILVIAMGIVLFIYKRLESLVYFFVFIDILLRIITFIKESITFQKIYTYINEYVPLSIINIIDKHTSGTINEILIWIYVGFFIMFEYYIIKTFFKKK